MKESSRGGLNPSAASRHSRSSFFQCYPVFWPPQTSSLTVTNTGTDSPHAYFVKHRRMGVYRNTKYYFGLPWI